MPGKRITVNPHVISALWAGALMITVTAGAVFARESPYAPLGDILVNAFLTPGFYLAIFMGIKGGPDGLPNLLVVFALTYAIWWAAIDVAQTVWRWIQAA